MTFLFNYDPPSYRGVPITILGEEELVERFGDVQAVHAKEVRGAVVRFYMTERAFEKLAAEAAERGDV